MLTRIGWEKIYHRVRIGPGKAVGFGLVGEKPVFTLPGGPPSNHMAFLQLTLPGLQKLAGRRDPGLPTLTARLAKSVRGQIDWTQFIHGRLNTSGDVPVFIPMRMKSRLQEMAECDAVATIPEGTALIEEGASIRVQLLMTSVLR
jgi:molybdopterin molybdotransferase